MSKIHDTISIQGRRRLSFMQAGKSDGFPVIVHAGTPGSRLLSDAWIQDATKQGIRLISYDRPGFGDSDPCHDRKVGDVAQDVRALASELGLERIAVWGHSGGGPHALACAAAMPDLVCAAASLAGLAPFDAQGLDWLEGMGENNVEEFQLATKGREALLPMIENLAPGLLAATPEALIEVLRTLTSPVDEAVLTGAYVQFLIDNTSLAITNSLEGWITDNIAFVTPWGVDLEQTKVPVLLMHGEHDRFVNVAHGKWLAKHISGVDARILPEDGHLTLAVNRIPEVHAWLLKHF